MNRVLCVQRRRGGVNRAYDDRSDTPEHIHGEERERELREV